VAVSLRGAHPRKITEALEARRSGAFFIPAASLRKSLHGCFRLSA
jgi:hypothetical protein